MAKTTKEKKPTMLRCSKCKNPNLVVLPIVNITKDAEGVETTTQQGDLLMCPMDNTRVSIKSTK